MRVVVYDEAGDVALDYRTQMDTVSLCPGRLEGPGSGSFAGGGVLHHGRPGTKPRGPQLSTACV
jgi:hypothetical protein